MFKTYFLLFCLLCTATALSAQYVPNYNFGQFQQQPCPFDPSATVNWPDRWQIYQTTDGHWDGPIDSSRCITGTAASGGYGLKIDLKQINATRPLFIRASMDSLPFATILEPDHLFNLTINANVAPAATPLIGGEDCPDQICTGALIGIAIPDEQGTPHAATRFQTSLFDVYAPNPNICYINGESCFPSERFADQYLREYILKFTFDSTANLGSNYLVVSSNQMWSADPLVGYITEVPAFTNPINVSDIVSGPGFIASFLGLYTAPGYPSPQNLSYIEARPIPNTSTPQDITLTVEPYQTLEMQPFAQFRGGLVAGSDTLRHHFTLLNDGGDLCINFLDLIFDGGDAYRHAGGHIDINNPYSCMQFRKGGELQVAEGATLHYGKQGNGMLQICAGGTIVLERNATLIVDAILQISECDDALPPSQIYMDLLPGSKLVFTENAWLTNRFSKNQQMQLQVRMLGGTLDDSALDPASKAVLRRIDPAPAPNFSKNVQLTPNPFGSALQLRYLAGGDELLRLCWYDVQGVLAREETFAAQKGWNAWTLKSPATAGFYFVEISSPGGRFTQPMVRLNE